jgi:hypothetical protein
MFALPVREPGQTWSVINFGNKPAEIFIGEEFAGTIDPGEKWPKN